MRPCLRDNLFWADIRQMACHLMQCRLILPVGQAYFALSGAFTRSNFLIQYAVLYMEMYRTI